MELLRGKLWNFTFNQSQESGVAGPRNHALLRFGTPFYPAISALSHLLPISTLADA
jgi:hypothetical protein